MAEAIGVEEPKMLPVDISSLVAANLEPIMFCIYV